MGSSAYERSIEQRFTKPAHPWTNGQVGRMNRTLKEATIIRFHYETTDQLNTHLQTFLLAYNFAKRLRGLPPTNSFAPNGGES